MVKLRAAIEKAKEERKALKPNNLHLNHVAAYHQKKGRVEIVPSVYTESRTVNLDPKILWKNKCVCLFSEAPEIESFRVLRSQILRHAREKDWNTFMVTSALPGEGKTLTSINLAFTFAKEIDKSVLLVDCDLRRPRIHGYLGIQNGIGLGHYLNHQKSIKDYMIWPGVKRLTLICGGDPNHDSSELIGSLKMKELAKELTTRNDARYVLFDAPSILSNTDAIALSSLVDGVIVVVQSGKTPIEDVKRALELLPPQKILGLVLNRKKSKKDTYAYP